MHSKLARLIALGVGAISGSLGSGCSTGMQAVVDSMRQVVQRSDAVSRVPLDPEFAYLRVTRGRHTGLLWRGSMERNSDGPVEVYYSSSGEVIRLQNGRIVGALGLTTEWRRVSIAGAPSWRAVAAGAPGRYRRTRDVMPGYRTGVVDDLTLKAVARPKSTALLGLNADGLTWFEETVDERGGGWFTPRGPDTPLPPARYAADLNTSGEPVVYAEQCIAADLCFTWQRWSAETQKAASTAR